MSSTQSVSISFYLPVQVGLLILYYGGIVTTMPWWLVWLPSLLVLGAIGVIIIIAIIAFIMAALD